MKSVSPTFRTRALDLLWAFSAAAVLVLAIGLSELVRVRWAAWPRVLSGVAYFGALVGLGAAVMVVLLSPLRRYLGRTVGGWYGAAHLRAEKRWAESLVVFGIAISLPYLARRLGRLEESAQSLGWILTMLGLVVAGGMVRLALSWGYRRLRRKLPLSWHRTIHFLVFLLPVIAIFLWLRRDLMDLISLLGWNDLAAAGTVCAIALLGPLMSESRVFRIVGLAAAVVVTGLATWHGVTPVERSARATIYQRTFVLGPAMRRVGQRAVYGTETAGGQSCWPGEEPVMDVGRIDGEAPDILLVMADGVRFDFTSLAGRRRLTPNLERWGRQAAVFTRAYTAAPSTRQSFRSLFTGLYPGVVASPPPIAGAPWGVTIAAGQQTMAGYLRRAGYATTALVSKPDAFPRQGGGLRGFEEIDRAAYQFERSNRYSASFIVNQILGLFAEAPDPSEPRFLWTHIMDPHYPYLRPRAVGPQARIGERQRYEWSLRYLDQELDRLIRWARSPERRGHTWVIFTSDHGEGWWEHENRRHGRTSYEEEIHVPLMIWGPEVTAGHYEEPVSLVDVLPTVLDVAGLEVPGSLCGESLLEGMQSGEFSSRPVLVSALPDSTRDYHHLAWIQGNEKLIVDGQTGIASLFDLGEDPNERTDLVESSPERAENALAALRGFLTERGMDHRTYGVETGRASSPPEVPADTDAGVLQDAGSEGSGPEDAGSGVAEPPEAAEPPPA